MKKLLLEIYWVITRIHLRTKGAQLGRNVKCNGFPHVKIRKGGSLIIENDVQINAAPWANSHVVSGSMNIFVGPGARLRIGEGAGVSGTRIVALNEIEIGSRTLIGGGCLLCDSDMHEFPLGSENIVKSAPIRIGDAVFIGAETIVLKGADIGHHATIGAGSVVTAKIPPGVVAAGTPARVTHVHGANK